MKKKLVIKNFLLSSSLEQFNRNWQQYFIEPRFQGALKSEDILFPLWSVGLLTVSSPVRDFGVKSTDILNTTNW